MKIKELNKELSELYEEIKKCDTQESFVKARNKGMVLIKNAEAIIKLANVSCRIEELEIAKPKSKTNEEFLGND